MAAANRPALPGLLVIVGPTGTGKSALALALAERLGSSIVGADSRQIYRELDVGTAKPTAADRDRIPHELIDLWPPTVAHTLADYQDLAQAAIARWQGQGVWPLLVGGTGLYVKAVTRGLKIPRVSPQPELRAQLAAIDQPQRYAWLAQVDPAATTVIHPQDARRTLRALEVFYASGRPISAQQGESPPPYAIVQIGLDCLDRTPTPTGQDRLTQRLAQRTAAMFAAGLVAETQALVDRYGAELPLLQTLGYREVLGAIAGQMSVAEAEAATVLHTRQFAKRQRTWFRADPTITWFEADDPALVDRVWAHWQAASRVK